MKKNTIYFRDLDTSQRSLYKKDLSLLTETTRRTIKNRLSHPLFDYWLVGFINGEGSFSVYKATAEKNEVISFSLGQTADGYFLCTLLQYRLSLFSSSVYLNPETGNYTIKTTSNEGIKKIYNFFNSTYKKHNIHLYGYKKIQFDNWVAANRMNERYNKSSSNKYVFLFFFNKFTPPLFIAQG